jgi:hypothetical protein
MLKLLKKRVVNVIEGVEAGDHQVGMEVEEAEMNGLKIQGLDLKEKEDEAKVESQVNLQGVPLILNQKGVLFQDLEKAVDNIFVC